MIAAAQCICPDPLDGRHDLKCEIHGRAGLVARGPYEQAGAYIGSELFDTSGMPGNFCEDCGHAPCVGLPAGERSSAIYCWETPRGISMAKVLTEIRTLWVAQDGQSWITWNLFSPAIWHLNALAIDGTEKSTRIIAERGLVAVLQGLRARVQS